MILCVKVLISIIKKRPFPKKMLWAVVCGFMIVSAIYVYRNYFFTFDRIDEKYTQKGPGPVPSPTERYTANAYYEPYGGAAGGVNVWVEVTYNNEKNKAKTVYYADAKDNFSMKWVDDDTLQILNDDPAYPNSDRSIKLVIGKEIYHENGLACKSWLMKGEYKNCYHN